MREYPLPSPDYVRESRHKYNQPNTIVHIDVNFYAII
jgi:hypothetical protein